MRKGHPRNLPLKVMLSSTVDLRVTLRSKMHVRNASKISMARCLINAMIKSNFPLDLADIISAIKEI